MPDIDIAVGEFSRRAGCNIETIRYYERIGLLPKPRREKGGRFRRYDRDDVAQLRFIRRARQLGFTLDEVRALLRLARGDGEDVRAQARGIAGAHVADICAKIADLQATERVLIEAAVAIGSGAAAHKPSHLSHSSIELGSAGVPSLAARCRNASRRRAPRARRAQGEPDQRCAAVRPRHRRDRITKPAAYLHGVPSAAGRSRS